MRRPIAALLGIGLLVSVACGNGGPADDADRTITTQTATTTEPSAVPPDRLVLASDSGVRLVDDDGTLVATVSDRPSAAAFGVGEDRVVFQDAAAAATYPPGPHGPARLWTDGATEELPADPGATRATLLDAGILAGAPVALVSERFGEVDPEDTFEALVVIGLEDGQRTTIVQRPAWESTHVAAALLGGGDVVGLVSAEGHLALNRWSAGADEPVWTSDIGFDVTAAVAVLDDVVAVVEPSFDEERDFAPVMTITPHDLDTGDRHEPRRFDLDDPRGLVEAGLLCAERLAAAELACSQGGAPPVAVSLDDGSVAELPGDPGTRATVVRR